MAEEETLSIIPDKKLLPTLGEQGYSFPQAISELVDNSIDSFHSMETRESPEITISFKVNGSSLTIEDNAEGMDRTQLASALRIAHTKSKQVGRTLGEYGIGMKAACTSLGKSFIIITTAAGSDKIYSVNYNEADWLMGSDDEWKIKVSAKETKADTHFTRITINDLKVKLYSYRKDQLLEHLSRRYSAYIKENIKIKVNGATVRPIEYIPEQKEDFEPTYYEVPLTERRTLGANGEIVLEAGKKIKGWVGLLQKSSQRGFYGLHLFRNKRLIDEFNKELLRSRTIESYNISAGHPSLARVIGEIEIDFVPVTFNKRHFNYESAEWKEAEDKIISDSNFRQIIARSRELAQMKSSILTPEKKKKLQTLSRYIFEKVGGKEIEITPSGMKWLLPVKDKNYKIESKILDLTDTNRMYLIEKSGDEFTIITNSNFPAFKITKDIVFYTALNLIDALSEIQTENDSLTEFKTRRTDILKHVSEFMGKIVGSKKGF